MNQTPKLTCPICKGDKFQWGAVGTRGGKVGFMYMIGNWRPDIKKARAATCEQCGYILQFLIENKTYHGPDETV